MLTGLSALNPPELVILFIALAGLIPVAFYFKQLSNWIVIAYGFLLIGAITTNVENLFWHDVFNFIEHSIGNLGAGVAFGIIAYLHRKRIRASTKRGPISKES